MKSAVILIPSYEPDENLIRIIETLKDNGYPILVVNDGSNPTFNNVFEKAKESAFVLSYDNNRGKGFALKYGYSKIPELFPEAKYVITVDGDGQHSIKDINRIYDKLCKTNKIVLGVRTFDKNTPPKSKFGNDTSKFTRSWLTKQYLPDDQCGLRGFPVEYIPELIKMKGNRYNYEMSQLVKLQLMHVELVKLPIETIYIEQNNGTHFAPFKDTMRIQSLIFVHGIPAIICSLILMALMMLSYRFSGLSSFATIYLSYLISTVLYIVLTIIIYPVKSILRCIGTEGASMILRMLLCHLILWIFVDSLGWNYFIMIPIAVFITSFFNVLYAYIISKIKILNK